MSVEAHAGDILAGRVVDDQLDVLLVERLQQVLDVDVEDAVDHLGGDGRERHDLSQTSQELRTEVALHYLQQLVVCGHLACIK